MYSLDEQLVAALKKRNFKEAENLLNQGADINAQNARGETPVFFFATNHTQDALKWLIDHGADVNVANKVGDTPLFSAVDRNELVATDLLINAGADVNKVNSRKIAPLMQVVLNEKDKGVFARLLEANPNLDCESESGTTPVLAAAARGKLEMVAALLDAGADPEASDYLGHGLLHAAISSRNANMLRMVLEKAPLLDPNYAARSGTTAMAETMGDMGMVKMLLDVGGDPNARSANRMNNGVSLLMSVLGNDPNAAIVYKKQKGEDNSAQIAQMMAAMGGAQPNQVIKDLIAKGANVGQRDDRGRNSMYYALASASTDNLPALIANGLDPLRPCDASGTLPYDLLCNPAVDTENSRNIELIEEWHAMGFPLVRPVWDDKLDGPWTRSIEESYQPMGSVVQNFVQAGYWTGLQKLLELGANVNDPGVNNATAAHAIVGSNYTGMTQARQRALQLASKAKNVDEATKQEQMDAIIQEAKDQLASVRATLDQHNIDWQAKTDAGQTPLHIAAKINSLEWAKFLVMEKNVDLTLRNDEGLTPAGAALKAGHLDMFHALSEIALSQGKNVRKDAVLTTTQASSDDFRERQPWLMAVASYEWTKEEINLQDDEGKTPIYIASATEQHDVVRTLLKLGADPNIQSFDGNTGIMEATFKEDGEVIRLLRAGGAKLDITNKQGHTVQNVADYIKSKYVHNALREDNLGELVTDLYVSPLSPAQKVLKERFNIKMDNVVRSWRGQEPNELPELTDEMKADLKKEEEARKQAHSATLTPQTGAAVHAPRSAANPKAPYKGP